MHKVITEYTEMMVSGEPQDVYDEGLRENFRRRLSSRPMPDYLFVDASQLGAPMPAQRARDRHYGNPDVQHKAVEPKGSYWTLPFPHIPSVTQSVHDSTAHYIL